ncbi:MAG: hypothetical protein ACRD0G_19250 [Acidimicrobiales bacterium]
MAEGEELPGWTARGRDDPPPDGDPPRVGVCCSGGGVRSAAFSLGALQVLRERGVLERASYLTAVSGGAYLASGWAVAAHRADGSPPPTFAPGSPEERWLRNNSSYLVPTVLKGLVGVSRLLAGVVVNLVLIWLVLFALGHPAGWFVSAVHPELRARQPLVRVSEQPRVALGIIESLGGGRFAVGVDAGDATVEEPMADEDRAVPVTVRLDQPALVSVDDDGVASILRQPALAVTVPEAFARESENADAGVPLLEIGRQPTLAVRGDAVVLAPDELAEALDLDRQPKLQVNTGLLGRPDVSFSGRDVVPGALLLGAGVFGWFVTMAASPVGRRTKHLPATALAVAGAGAVWLGAFVVLPWAVQEVPDLLVRLVDRLPNVEDAASPAGSGLPGYLLPTSGFLAIAVTAARRYFNAARATTEPAERGPWWRRVWDRLSGAENTLAWYELSPLKIVVGVLAVLAPVVLLVGQVRYGAANGLDGELVGLSVLSGGLESWLQAPDVLRWLAVVGVLGVLLLVDAHSWSLYPFYKRRLAHAYFAKRTARGPRPLGFDDPLRFTAPRKGQPQLIVCCAVNLSDEGAVPPGRRAASFTFSSTEVGGPLTGYVHPRRLWRFVGPRGDAAEVADRPTSRRKDVTIPAAMAISGAAFSPAMGKFNLGPVGSILALANARLGVWLLRPGLAAERGADEAARWPWWRRPAWPYFLREVANRYRAQRNFVYVSDGGHWENLGLVELLRRGCTEIYCINAGGDGLASFGTIAESIALAREELGVEIDIDPTPLRPPVEVPRGGVRELRRRVNVKEAEALARRASVRGTFTYPARMADGDPAEPVRGTIVLIEPALTGDLPFDVHGHAEAEAIFPDDSTGDQLFDHRQFESFRRLGQHQMARALANVGSFPGL